jgi:prefoldin subunit 5
VANEKKERVEQETNVIQVKTEQIELINNQAMAQLNESMPTIVKAEQEVRNIDKKELSTLRHLTAPPAMIEFIFSTVCLVLEEKYLGWRQTGIKLLNDLNKFIESLVDKIDRIKTQGSSVVSQAVISSLAKNLKNDFFSEAKLESNVIARPLGIWCKAIYDFTVLKRQIEPLEKNAKEMSDKLAESQKEYDVMARNWRCARPTSRRCRTSSTRWSRGRRSWRTPSSRPS